MKNLFFLSLSSILLLLYSCGNSMETTERGIEYRIITSSDTGKAITKNSQILLHMIMKAPIADSLGGGDTIIFNTFVNQKPFSIPSDEPVLKSVFLLLKTGDSAEFNVDADTLYNISFGQPTPSFLKKDARLSFYVKIVDAYTKEDLMKMQKQKMEEFKTKDSLALAAYIATLKDVKSTGSGLLYQIKKAGKGKAVAKGDSVFVNYKGMLLNGETFDQQVDEKQTYGLIAGISPIIEGWKEGLLLMHVGDEYTFIIPWKLAYAERGAQPVIPPFATLVFDIKLVNAKANKSIK